VSNFKPKLEFAHTSYANTAEDYVGLEISLVFRGVDEILHFKTESLDIR
jgi:hypothetical protein